MLDIAHFKIKLMDAVYLDLDVNAFLTIEGSSLTRMYVKKQTPEVTLLLKVVIKGHHILCSKWI